MIDPNVFSMFLRKKHFFLNFPKKTDLFDDLLLDEQILYETASNSIALDLKTAF